MQTSPSQVLKGVALLPWIAALSMSEAVGQPLAFTEEAVARGITPHNVGIYNFTMYGAGIGFADLDGDGDPDLVALGRTDGRIGIFENDGTGHFTPRRSGSGLAFNPLLNGVSFADFDNDGDLDIYFSCHGQPAALYRNNGHFTFTDVAAQAGVNDAGAGQGLTWGDFDGDGWLDLYLANRSSIANGLVQPNRLYRNNHDGTFTDIAAVLGVDDAGVMSFQGGFFDYDRDGDPDLYVAEDKGLPDCNWHNRLWRNDQGTFTDVSIPSGAGACMDGMCVTIGDSNADGWQDVYVTNTQSGNKLFRGSNNGVFDEGAKATGTALYQLSWGSQWLDFDHDGLLDLYVLVQLGPNVLNRQEADGTFTDIAPQVGLDMNAYSFCTAVADVDGDGDLDIATIAYLQPLKLYINHEGERRSWVKLRVISPGARRDAIGAIVDLTSQGRSQTRELISTSGFKSQNEAVLHFGLGGASTIGQITVTWPHGGGTRVLRNYPANATWTIYPDSKLGDADQDGTLTSADFFAFLSCFFNASGAMYAPGCEAMDMDGDGAATSADFFEFLVRFFNQ